VGTIRVVGGELRGRRIPVPDQGVRPTSERTREAIFDILGPERITEARVLDLHAGTGALGIEALSRGADFADFIERDAGIVRRLQGNLKTLGLLGRGRVHRADLDSRGLTPTSPGPWRMVFLDPPFGSSSGARWLELLSRMDWGSEGGIVVHERGRADDTPPPPGLSLLTERRYGDTKVAIYRTAAFDAGSGDATRGGS
jgi:16S rRNA (guanine966-N2)-methyltransferase